MAQARRGFQIRRVSHLKASNLQQRFCCWIDKVFVARPDPPAGPVHRKLRTYSGQCIRAAMADGGVCVFLLAGLTLTRKSIAPLKSSQRSSGNCVKAQRRRLSRSFLAKAKFSTGDRPVATNMRSLGEGG